MSDLEELVKALTELAKDLPDGMDIRLSIAPPERSALVAMAANAPCKNCKPDQDCCWTFRRGWYCC